MALTTAQTLTAGKATFTLSGPTKDGTQVRYTYRIDRVENSNKPAVYFVKVLVGPDNSDDYTYLGVYDPAGNVRLTKASKFANDSLPVQVIRRFAVVVASAQEDKMTAAGWTVHWSCRCQRCGRVLTVPSSVDARIGPDCAAMMGFVPVKTPKAKTAQTPAAKTQNS